MTSSAFHPKLAIPLNIQERITMFLSLVGTMRIKNELRAHNRIDRATEDIEDIQDRTGEDIKDIQERRGEERTGEK